jgi:hypothetical protein
MAIIYENISVFHHSKVIRKNYTEVEDIADLCSYVYGCIYEIVCKIILCFLL